MTRSPDPVTVGLLRFSDSAIRTRSLRSAYAVSLATHGEEEQEMKPSTAPVGDRWDVTALQRMLMDAFKAGAEFGLQSSPAMVAAACEAVVVRESVPDEEFNEIEDIIQRHSLAAEERFARRWDEAFAYWIEAAIEAAVLLGVRHMGAAVVDRDGEREAVAALWEDELWAWEFVRDLLVQVVQSMGAAGYGIPGAQRFLDRCRPARPPRIFEVAGEHERLEIRTDWIRDHDTAEVYQWFARAQGSRVLVARRLKGRTTASVELSVSAAQARCLAKMLEEITKSGLS